MKYPQVYNDINQVAEFVSQTFNVRPQVSSVQGRTCLTAKLSNGDYFKINFFYKDAKIFCTYFNQLIVNDHYSYQAECLGKNDKYEIFKELKIKSAGL